jgi:hypothetical protein
MNSWNSAVPAPAIGDVDQHEGLGHAADRADAVDQAAGQRRRVRAADVLRRRARHQRVGAEQRAADQRQAEDVPRHAGLADLAVQRERAAQRDARQRRGEDAAAAEQAIGDEAEQDHERDAAGVERDRHVAGLVLVVAVALGQVERQPVQERVAHELEAEVVRADEPDAGRAQHLGPGLARKSASSSARGTAMVGSSGSARPTSLGRSRTNR